MWRVWALIGLLSVLPPSIATAQTDDSASERARALFREALTFADHGEWDRAVERFRQALDLRASAPIRFNLAQSLVHMGRLVEARDELRLVRADPTVADDVRRDASALDRQLARQLGRLTVEVRGPTEGSSVTIDGRPIPPELVGHPTDTDPGVRIARLIRGADLLDVQEVEVRAGGLARVVLEAPLLFGSNGAPEAHGDDAWIWAVVVSAVVLVAGGAAVLGWALTQPGSPSTGDFGPPLLELD